MASIIKQSFQNKQSTRTLKPQKGLKIFNKLTLKKTSVPGIKAQKSVYKQRQTNMVETELRDGCSQLRLLQSQSNAM